MTGRCAVTDDAELTGAPLFEIRTDVASAGVRICVVGGDAGMAEDARARLVELAGRWSAHRRRQRDQADQQQQGHAGFRVRGDRVAGGPGPAGRPGDPRRYDPRASRGSIDPIAYAPAAAGGDSGAAWTKGSPSIPVSGPSPCRADAALDLRGVDRGLAADLVVADMLDAGAYGVCVDVGGHVRAAGAAPSRAGWLLRLDQSPASGTRRRRAAARGRRRHKCAPRRHRPRTEGRQAIRWRRGGHRRGRHGLAGRDDRPGRDARRVSRRRHAGRARRRRGVVLLRRRDAPIHCTLAGVRSLTARAGAPRRRDGGRVAAWRPARWPHHLLPAGANFFRLGAEHGDARRRCRRRCRFVPWPPDPTSSLRATTRREADLAGRHLLLAPGPLAAGSSCCRLPFLRLHPASRMGRQRSAPRAVPPAQATPVGSRAGPPPSPHPGCGLRPGRARLGLPASPPTHEAG